MKDLPIEIFDLLETSSFEELSNEQRQFVLIWMNEQEYRMYQMVTAESKQLDYSVPEAAPLIIPTPAIPVWKKPIPIWQAMLGIAATILIFFFIPQQKSESMESVPETYPVAQVIHDTIVKQLPADTIFTVATRWVIDTVYISSALVQDLPQRILDAPKNLYIPWGDAVAETASTSLKDEKNKISIPEAIRVRF
jgi:hypothetical protein